MIDLFLGRPAALRPQLAVGDGRFERLDASLQFGKHLPGDLVERFGDALAQPQLQFLGVDAVVAQLPADVVDRFGHALRLLAALAAVLQGLLDAKGSQGQLPLRRRLLRLRGLLARLVRRLSVLPFPPLKLRPQQQVAGLGHVLNDRLQPLPLDQFAGFQHRAKLLRRDHVQQPPLADADVRLGAKVAIVGGLEADEQFLARLELQFARFQGDAVQRQFRGAAPRRQGRNGRRFALVDRALEPHPSDPVVVGRRSRDRQASLRHNGRADPGQTGRHLRRLVGDGGQRQLDRLAGLDPVGVQQAERQRRVARQGPPLAAEAHAVGRHVFRLEDSRRLGGLLIGGKIDLHADQLLVRPARNVNRVPIGICITLVAAADASRRSM